MTPTEYINAIKEYKTAIVNLLNTKTDTGLSDQTPLLYFASFIKDSIKDTLKLKPSTLTRLLFNTKLEYADLSIFDTSDVTSLDSLVYESDTLKSVNIDGWNITSKLTNLYCVFYKAKAIEHLDLSGWDTSKVTNMSWAFNSNYKLQDLNLDGWDFAECNNYTSMFGHYGAILTYVLSLILGNFTNLGNKSTSLTFFQYLPSLDNDSVQRIINGLAVTSGGTIQFHNDVKANITLELISQITAKGWTLA